jgi:NO-binding membrane sensor protein with MHYT domain
VVTVHNFSNGLLNPALAYAVSCLGAFLGLRCVTRARAYTGFSRARWLVLASVALGATGIWTMHFIAMLGFSIPDVEITYNVPLTILSMLIAILVVGVGLFIVGFGNGGWTPLATGGVIVGIGVASMHYLGMAAMSMPEHQHYNAPLFVLSVAIAIVAGTAALWAGTRVRGIRATIGASLIMGVAVSGMHYTGMAAMRVSPGPAPTMPGSSGSSFLVPLILGISLVTFVLTLTISLSPTEDEIRADAELQRRIDNEFPADPRVSIQGASAQGASAQGASGQGASAQGASAQGASGQGTFGQGAVGQRAVGQRAVGQPNSQPAHAGRRASAGGSLWSKPPRIG